MIYFLKFYNYFTIDLLFNRGRVRMSIVQRGTLATKGLIDADSAALIVAYTVHYISFARIMTLQTKPIPSCLLASDPFARQ